MGGLGLRSHFEVSSAAFMGGLEQSLPHFTIEDGVCPHLVTVLGDWQEQVERRWEHLIQSGSRAGRELVTAWNVLQVEARQCSTYLGQELEGPLS